jgi:hypothetical protein
MADALNVVFHSFFTWLGTLILIVAPIATVCLCLNRRRQ